MVVKGQKVIMDKNKEFNFDEIQRALEEKVEVQETEAPGESEVSEKKQGAEKEWKNEESKETAKEGKNEESQRREKKWEDEESRETPKEEREEFRKTEDVDEERESKTSEEDGNFQRTEDTGESWNGRQMEEREAFLKSEEAAVTFQKRNVNRQGGTDSSMEAGTFPGNKSSGCTCRRSRKAIVEMAEKEVGSSDRNWARHFNCSVFRNAGCKVLSYDNYTVQTDFTGEDTTAASYRKVEDKVLKYSLDGAACK